MDNAELTYDFNLPDNKLSKSDLLKECLSIMKSYDITGKYNIKISKLSRSFRPNGSPELYITVQVIPAPAVKITKHGEDRFYNCTSEITEIEYNFWSKVHG